MESRLIFTETLGVQEGSYFVHLLFVLNTSLFFLGVQVPHFPFRVLPGAVILNFSHSMCQVSAQ